MTSLKKHTSMKPAYFILLLFFMLNCDGVEEKDDLFCGVANPGKDLIWLKEIIDIAETRQNVNYLGYIYAEEYLGNDVVYIEMSLGSGGLMGHWFNCDGTPLVFISSNPPQATRNKIIYSSLE